MPEQTAANVLAAIKREAALTPGVAATAGAGALQMRLTDSPGLTLARGNIQSGERRADDMTPMGRLGGKSVGGSYNSELSVGGFTDSLMEAGLRRIWSAALVMALADGATTANTITRATGSWITSGVKVGDIVTITTDATAANNNLRLRVTAVTATTLTLAGNPLTVNATARAFTVTRLKKLTTAGLRTNYSYTVEQYDEDIDVSELFLGCRLSSFALSFRPNAHATVSWTFVGMDRTLLTIGTSPWFTAPDVTTGISLVADDSAIRFNGIDVAKFTGMDLTVSVEAAGQPVIGSLVTPDIYTNTANVTGSISAIREDFSRLTMYDSETEFELSVLLSEPVAAPRPAIGIYLPRVKVASAEAPFLGGNGPKIETMNLMVGPHAGSAIIDASAINIFSTAA